MSRIHIARDRQPLGQFDPEEVAEGLKSGRFLPTDLAWREGMAAWEPLSTFADLPSASGAAATPPDLTPLIAPGAEVLEPISSTVPTPAWEDEKPFMTRLFETIRQVLLAPAEAFANVPKDNAVIRTIGFMLLVGWPALAVSFAYQYVMDLMMAGMQPEVEQLGPGLTGLAYAAAVIFLPLILVIGSFVSSAVFHGILMMLGAANRPYWTTFRVVTYVNGATMVLLLVPLCGSLAQSIWAIYSLAVGLKTAHQTTWTNTIIALLLPTVICCGLIIGAISLGFTQFLNQ